MVLSKKQKRSIKWDTLTAFFRFDDPPKKRICSSCGQREVFLDIKAMDWCENCINDFVNESDD